LAKSLSPRARSLARKARARLAPIAGRKFMASSLVRKLVSFALCPSLGTLDTGGNPIPVSRAWRIGDLVKSFVPIMLTDARLSGLLLPWTVQLEPSIAPIANGSTSRCGSDNSQNPPIAARDRTVIGRRARPWRDPLSFAD